MQCHFCLNNTHDYYLEGYYTTIFYYFMNVTIYKCNKTVVGTTKKAMVAKIDIGD